MTDCAKIGILWSFRKADDYIWDLKHERDEASQLQESSQDNPIKM